MLKKYFVIVDLEMCMVSASVKKKNYKNKTEIIQIGAVMLDGNHRIVGEFSSYVKPEYGRIDSFIENLTGITQEQVDQAPKLQTILINFINWIGDKDVIVLSWSESDRQQLKSEMRTKRIKNNKVKELFDKWVDLQYSFDQMLGVNRQCALKEALSMSKIQIKGRIHDGLCDAYNTAKLFAKIHRQSVFTLKLIPISEYEKERDRLSYSLGDLFTPALLEQISQEEEISEKIIFNEKDWSIWRKLYGLIKGKKAAGDEQWNKLLFGIEMIKINILDLFFGNKCIKEEQKPFLY